MLQLPCSCGPEHRGRVRRGCAICQTQLIWVTVLTKAAPPSAPRTVQAASPTDVRQSAGQRSAKHPGSPEMQYHETGCGQRPAPGCRIQAPLVPCRFRMLACRRLLAPARRMEAMQTFPSWQRQAIDQHVVRSLHTARPLDAGCPRCAGTTPTNRPGRQYPRTGTSRRDGSLRLQVSHPSARSDDDRNGKPGVNRGRKATGLGA